MVSPARRALIVMRSLPTFAVTALIALLSGCSDSPSDLPEPPDPSQARVLQDHLFAGSEVTIQGEWYRHSGAWVSFVVDGQSVQARRIDDSTVAVALPPTWNGDYSITEQTSQGPAERGPFTVYGFDASTAVPVGPYFAGMAPISPEALGLVMVLDTGGVTVVDLRSGTSKRYGGVGAFTSIYDNCPWIPGPSYRPGVMIVPDGYEDSLPPAGSTAWVLWPDSTRLEQLAVRPLCGLAEVAPHLYAQTGRVGRFALIETDTAGNFVRSHDLGTTITNLRFFISPDRRWLTTRSLKYGGILVVDIAAKSPGYVVPWVEQLNDAEFSEDGESLYIIGDEDLGNDLVIRVDATTGDSLAAIVPGGLLGSIAIDSAGKVAYVAGRDPSDPDRIVINVLDAHDFRLLGRFETRTLQACHCHPGDVLVVDSDGSQLLLASPGYQGEYVLEIFRFRLPPTGN